MIDPPRSSHYDKKYYRDHQEEIGRFGGWANLPKFEQFLDPDDRVLDFGCGGGFLLEQLPQPRKIGLEINAEARDAAIARGLTVYSSLEDIPNGSIDVVVSNHVLEHTLHPLDEIKSLAPKLADEGRLIFYVPCEGIERGYSPDDPNNHIYTWNPMCLGNLFHEAGFHIERCEAYYHRWPPYYRAITRLGGRRLFDLASRLFGYLTRHRMGQVRVLARRRP